MRAIGRLLPSWVSPNSGAWNITREVRELINEPTGNYHTSQGNLLLAIRCFQRVMKLNPTDYDAVIALGHAFMEVKDLNKAVESYKKAIGMLTIVV
jgi:Flp pilus assembly protein TadD